MRVTVHRRSMLHGASADVVVLCVVHDPTPMQAVASIVTEIVLQDSQQGPGS